MIQTPPRISTAFEEICRPSIGTVLAWGWTLLALGVGLAYGIGYARGWELPTGNVLRSYGSLVGVQFPIAPLWGAVIVGAIGPALFRLLAPEWAAEALSLTTGRGKVAFPLLLAVGAASLTAANAWGTARARREAACAGCRVSRFSIDGKESSGKFIRCSETHCLIESDSRMLIVRKGDVTILAPTHQP